MRPKPKAALDVIETYFAIDSLDEKLSELGLSAGSARQPNLQGFAEIAIGAFASLLAENKIEPNAEKMEGVIKTFATLPVQPDGKEGIELLREAGIRVAALTNGSAAMTRKMFAGAGLEDAIEKFISIEKRSSGNPPPRSISTPRNSSTLPRPTSRTPGTSTARPRPA